MSTTPSSRPLTKAQIEYASTRIREIRCEKISAFKATLPKAPDAPSFKSYSDSEKLAFIRSGKATIKDGGDHYGYVTNAFNYPERKRTAAEQKQLDAHNKISKANADAERKFTAALDKKVTVLQDKLHLGDSAATLALIDAFAAE